MLRQYLCIGDETTTPPGHRKWTPSLQRKSKLLLNPLWCQIWTPGSAADPSLRRLLTRTIRWLNSVDEAHGWHRKSVLLQWKRRTVKGTSIGLRLIYNQMLALKVCCSSINKWKWTTNWFFIILHDVHFIQNILFLNAFKIFQDLLYTKIFQSQK